jgi:hypothetical protein
MLLDLTSILPQLLGPAIAWAESMARQVEREGKQLDVASLALASKVGVRRPNLIQLKLVTRIPLPDHSLLRESALQAGLLGSGTVGLTLGYGIFIVEGNLSPRLLAHECRHVYQYETHGSIAEFLPVYLGQIVTSMAAKRLALRIGSPNFMIGKV